MAGDLEKLVGAVERRRPTHEIVAEALRRQITLGRLRPGDSLPSERELSRWLGVGRTTLRKAIRVLSREGWVDTKLGRGGGTVVLACGNGVQDEPSQMLEQCRVAIEYTYEIRLALEPATAGLAASRATSEQIVILLEMLEESANTVDAYHSLDSLLHLKVAEASKNPLLLNSVEKSREEFFMWANALWLNVDWLGVHARMGDPEQAFEVDHRPFVEAIARREPEGARCGMEAHLKRGRDHFRELLRQISVTETHREP